MPCNGKAWHGVDDRRDSEDVIGSRLIGQSTREISGIGDRGFNKIDLLSQPIMFQRSSSASDKVFIIQNWLARLYYFALSYAFTGSVASHGSHVLHAETVGVRSAASSGTRSSRPWLHNLPRPALP